MYPNKETQILVALCVFYIHSNVLNIVERRSNISLVPVMNNY